MSTKGAKTAYMRLYRAGGRDIDSRKAYARAQTLAASWVKQNHPDIYEALLDQAYAETGSERRPARQSRKDAT